MRWYYSNDRSVAAIIEGGENGKTLFCVKYGSGWPVYEMHKIQYYAWAMRPHGNAPSGTPYAYFRASRNGKRVILTT